MPQIASWIRRSPELGYAVPRRWKAFVQWHMRQMHEMLLDRLHNVDTFKAADEVGPGVPYDASPWSALPNIFEHLPLGFDRFAFVDIGAGKGRIVLAAAAFPFASVIGVEASPSLCRIAENNLAACRWRRRRARSVAIVERDATKFAIPDVPCIFFFYNPFSFTVMESVISNIVRSYRHSVREIYLICVGMSTCFAEVAAIPPLKLLHSFDIPVRLATRRSVYVFSVADGPPAA